MQTRDWLEILQKDTSAHARLAYADWLEEQGVGSLASQVYRRLAEFQPAIVVNSPWDCFCWFRKESSSCGLFFFCRDNDIATGKALLDRSLFDEVLSHVSERVFPHSSEGKQHALQHVACGYASYHQAELALIKALYKSMEK